MTGAFLTGFNGAGNNNSKLFSGSGEGKSINTVATNVASFPQSSTTSTVGPKLQNHLFTPTTDTRNDNLMKLSEVVPQFNTNHRQSDGTVGQGAVNNDMPATVMLQEILRRLSHSNMNTTPATDIKNNNNGTGAGAGGVSNSSSGTNNFVSYPTSKTSSPPPFTNQHLRSMSIGKQ